MSPFKVLFICIQACLLQMAYTQVITGINNAGGWSAGSVNSGFTGGYAPSDVAAVAALPVAGPYGGTGTGEITVAGEVQATGQTIVTGQVPVIGTVSFSGSIPASGVVSIAGNCGCANAL
ncbi:chorion class CA protein ERA.1-like [Ostrinia nubilalis]|uniref:chorion class CA protein ERA.1-like n=1 Tax=Ostrinia nubilalis TaxID=29057 RepID=UPI00308229E2